MSHLQTSGLKILRVWGFNDVNTTPGSGTVWYQSLSGSTPTINTGVNGLQRLDYVVKSAEAHGIKLIINFVNNWDDYGGIKAYTNCELCLWQDLPTFPFPGFQNHHKVHVARKHVTGTNHGPASLIQNMLIRIAVQIMAAHIRLGTPTLPHRPNIEHTSRPSSAATSQALQFLPGN